MAMITSRIGRFYTVEQVAEILVLSEKTIHRCIADGRLRSHEFGRSVRISEHDFASFAAARRR